MRKNAIGIENVSLPGGHLKGVPVILNVPQWQNPSNYNMNVNHSGIQTTTNLEPETSAFGELEAYISLAIKSGGLLGPLFVFFTATMPT